MKSFLVKTRSILRLIGHQILTWTVPPPYLKGDGSTIPSDLKSGCDSGVRGQRSVSCSRHGSREEKLSTYRRKSNAFIKLYSEMSANEVGGACDGWNRMLWQKKVAGWSLEPRQMASRSHRLFDISLNHCSSFFFSELPLPLLEAVTHLWHTVTSWHGVAEGTHLSTWQFIALSLLPPLPGKRSARL